MAKRRAHAFYLSTSPSSLVAARRAAQKTLAKQAVGLGSFRKRVLRCVAGRIHLGDPVVTKIGSFTDWCELLPELGSRAE
eukprot:5686612-Pyramimonas_sp.AAC.1